MARIYRGSASDRLARFRDALTIDLVRRAGPFWTAIEAVRERWRVEPAVAVPTLSAASRYGQIRLFLPGTHPDPSRLAQELGVWDSDRFPLDGIPGEILQVVSEAADPVELLTHPVALWYLDLKRLHDAVIPERARSPIAPFREAAWVPFLSACVLFAPPRDRLREFAHGWVPQLFAKAVQDAPVSAAAVEPLTDGPLMLNGPIVTLEDAEAVQSAEQWLYFAFYDFLREYLGQTRDLDLDAVVEEAAVVRREAWDALHDAYFDRLSAALLDRHRYISVDAATTREDVLAAFAVLKAGFPPPAPGRPTREPLTCVQVAIWRDELDLAHREIAGRLGWKIGASGENKAWSERIRQHAKDGRAILMQRRSAA